ncbi:ATP-binding cassette domain-containing protein [Corynebacterium pseudotuberculosis]|nr:ATP-binding cassette domain-containing protein [Corynebacterium pseudotuberculosis]QGX02808.1 ATP-binding cassette domain-containing protein [Corynebacterium pseudotuberculosis 316]QGY56296.1 ATP-binding cassette domain-containing protein [Corynebacterium pseudotuberculosis]
MASTLAYHGTNGCGKSTLVNWIAAGAPPTTAHSDASGTITRDDRLVLIPQRLPPSKAIPVSQKPYGMKASARWAQELFIPPCGISWWQHCLRAINGALR